VCNLEEFRYRKISQNATVNDLVKELVRKSIHISAALTVLLARFWYGLTLGLVAGGVVVYSICEVLRLQGVQVPLVSRVTQIASRQADEGKFVLGPVTLGIGILLSLMLFKTPASTVAIFALTFGDGLASLVGKIHGNRHFKLVTKKTFAGSAACFVAVFVSSYFTLHNFLSALILALLATVVEVLPLKNLDNIAIPLAVGFCASLLGV
jgi:cytidylyltransferase family